MPEEYDNDLLREGLLHFNSKDYSMARQYFERALSVADDSQTRCQANFYLSQLVDDPIEQRKFLEETLAIDMGHAGARRAIAILDGKLDPAGIVNPEAIPAPLPGTQTVQADRFTCSKCGARLHYSPDGNSLVCDHCSRQQGILPGTPGAKQDFFVAMANGKGFLKTISAKTFQCQGCSASFLLAPLEISATCAYCGSVHVMATQPARDLVAPDAVIPMSVDEKQASLQFVQWMLKKHLDPKDRLGNPRGLYLPVWVTRNQHEEPISGEIPAIINDVCIPASRKLASMLPKLLPEYNLAAAPAYDPRFLVGWPAEVYEIAMSDAALEARWSTIDKLRREIQAAHGNIIDLRYASSTISITSFRLILLPVWVTAYSFEGRTHRVVINGQTGTVHGESSRPALKNILNDLLGA
jgi:DNA-directed RNA polymerase subunit RPC12/RpoP